MKTRKWQSLLSVATILLCFSSCQDWGKWDPPAGNQVYPTLQLVSDNSFDSLSEDWELFTYNGGSLPKIAKDEELGDVLHTDGGYLRFDNPLNGVTLQSGASLTFWVKLSEADSDGALLSFSDEDSNSKLFFTAGGRIAYHSPDGSFERTLSPDVADSLSSGTWRYMALIFTTNGYEAYMDGKSIERYDALDFDFEKVRDFLMSASAFYLAYGSGSQPVEAWFDDLKIYRNSVTAREISVPKVSGGEDEFQYQFPPLNTVGYYKLDGTFENSLNPSHNGELITIETQATPSDFKDDADRGLVWQQQEGWTGHDNGWAYTRFDNSMKGAQLVDGGLTLTMWVNPPAINWWDQIFVLNDGTSKFWINALGYVGYNGDGGWFDCHNNNNAHAMKAGEWTMFTFVVTAEEFTVYYNDEVKFTSSDNGGYGGDLNGYQKVLDFFTSANDFYFGYETFWKAAPAIIDDLFLIARPVSAREVKMIYQDTKKSNGGNVENPSYIPETTVGQYRLDGNFDNAKNPAQSGEFVVMEAQSTKSDFKNDADRGLVWQQQEGWTGHDNGWAYTRFDNPMKGAQLADGLTLSMWINPPAINWWDQIFVLNDGTSKFWINALGYVGYNGDGGWFDCHNNNNAHAMTAGEWTMFTIVVTADEFIVYYNDEVKFTSSDNGGYGGDLNGYQKVLDMFTSANDFYFGYETFWKAAPALIDDVFLCKSPLTERQVKALYNGTKK